MDEAAPEEPSLGRIDALESRLEAVERRLAALASAEASAHPAAQPTARRAGGPDARGEVPESAEALEANRAGEADPFWALAALKRRLGEGADDERMSGGVVYAGRAVLAGMPYEWQYGHPAIDLADPAAETIERSAAVLAALGAPVRLRLLLEVLRGTTSTAALIDLEGVGTSGQVYHHLGRLVDAGWLRHRRRGHMEVPPERVVPLLTVLSAVR